jgi:hypothetical protein
MEFRDRRILGALRCVDGVTGLPVSAPVRVVAPGLTLSQGTRGMVVIQDAPGLAALQGVGSSFARQHSAPPTGQAWPVQVTLTLHEASGRYLPRQARISLPRDSAPDAADSVFQPFTIELFPSPAAPIAAGWAVLRATVLAERSGGSKRRLPWAWLRVLPVVDDDAPPPSPLALAMADGRGEALIAVRALPLSFGEAGRRRSDLPVVVQVVFDGRLRDLPQDLAGDAIDANAGYLADPQALDGPAKHLRDGLSQPLTLVAGRDQAAELVTQLTDRPP